MVEQARAGTISWVDLSSPDIDDAQLFYRKLLGWDLATTTSSMGDYVTATVGGRDVAGMMAQSPDAQGQPASWTMFVWVDDIDESTQAIAEAGGSVVVPPFEIPGGARVSVVTDPDGAMFALVAGGPTPGAYFSTTPGAVGWAELMTRRTDRASVFYHSVFGWESSTEDGGGVPYTVFRLGDLQVAGMIETPAHLPTDVPATWSVSFVVADCGATEQRVVELGGSVLHPTTPTPMGPFAVVADRQGAVFQVMEYQVMEFPMMETPATESVKG